MFRFKVSAASTQSVLSNSEESKKVNDWLDLLQVPLGLYEIFNGRFGESNKSLASKEANFFRCLSEPAVERSNCVLTAAACDLWINLKKKSVMRIVIHHSIPFP
jgi:hypothetical protein